MTDSTINAALTANPSVNTGVIPRLTGLFAFMQEFACCV